MTPFAHRITRLTAAIFLCGVLASKAGEAQTLPGCNSLQFRIEQIDVNHIRLIDQVEIDCADWKLYADEADLFVDTDELIASGNVVFTSESSRIAADRLEFNTRTRTGTFYHAFGTSFIGDRVDRSMFGTLEPEAYFWGETLEKLGERKYRLTNGGFTTCVQPTPRWELSSSTVVLNLGDYAVLRNAVLRVKGVPLFYLPLFYSPIQEDDRATGFLIPSYGTSTLKGQALSNAFFWAINRSHDVTLLHDWFSGVGQGTGAEYRYMLGPGSQGSARTYSLNERAFTPLDSSGGATLPARRSQEITGSAMQTLGSSVVARGHVDYFSDVTVQQTFHTQVLEASRRDRRVGGNVTGAWGSYNLSGALDWTETFFGDTESTVHGSTPRVSFSQAEQPLGRLPVYFSFGSRYTDLLRQRRSGDQQSDTGLTRLDLSPVVRVPFTRWPFLTINSSVGWTGTYWTERLDEQSGVQVEDGIARRYFNLQSQITGPAFVRIWDTPNSGYAERFKHVIEPWVTLQRVTAIDNFDQIVQLEGDDSIVGNTTRIAYGLTNRFYAKRGEGGSASVAREILNVAITQSYYTDARAAQFDRQFRTSFNGTAPSNFSPLALMLRATPTNQISGTLRAEYDTQFGALRTISADMTMAVGGRLQATGGWSQRRFIEGLPGFNDPSSLDHYLNGSANVRSLGNVVGGQYSFNYDLLGGSFLQQRILGYYNAQCCGVAVEYQTFNFGGLATRARVPHDRRFNISFTLAGIGTFSNFFGALGGGPGR